MLGRKIAGTCLRANVPSVAATSSTPATQTRNSHTIWYPDAKFERQFKVDFFCWLRVTSQFSIFQTGGTLGKLWMSERVSDFDEKIGLDKLEKLAYSDPVMSDNYSGKQR